MTDLSKIATLPRDTSPPWSPVARRSSGNGNGELDTPIHRTSRSSTKEAGTESIPGLAHSEASIDVTSINTLDNDVGHFIEDSGKTDKETSDDESPLIGLAGLMEDEIIYPHDSILELDDDDDGAEEVTKPNDAATTTSQSPRLRRTAKAINKCPTEAHACAEVRIGNEGYITRWRQGSELSYVVCKESFPTEDSATSVGTALKTAISMWKGIGVRFKQVERHEEATFAVVYPGSYHEDWPDDAYASSFFPKASTGKLLVYKLGLSNADYMANILAHEVGHILGLRHEFAHKREAFNHSVLVGKENDDSVMNYFGLGQLSKHRVTEQDLQDLAKVYALDQAEYQGMPICEVDPVTSIFPPRAGNDLVSSTSSAAVTTSPAMPFACKIYFFIFFLSMLFTLGIVFIFTLISFFYFFFTSPSLSERFGARI